jgi:hypothetical protein
LVAIVAFQPVGKAPWTRLRHSHHHQLLVVIVFAWIVFGWTDAMSESFRMDIEAK